MTISRSIGAFWASEPGNAGLVPLQIAGKATANQVAVDLARGESQGRPMRFISDNAAPACPAALTALSDVNVVDTAYDLSLIHI